MSEIPYESEQAPLNMPGSKESLVDDIAVLNSLHYSLPSSLSSMVKRANKISYGDKNPYTNTDSEMIVRINASSDYAKWQNSYLTFDIILTVPNIAAAVANNVYITLGSAGAIGLVCRRVVVETKSGTQAVYVDYASNHICQELYAKNSPAYIADVAQPALMLISAVPIATVTVANVIPATGAISPYIATGNPFNNTQQNTSAPNAPVVALTNASYTNLNDVNLGSWSIANPGVFTPIKRKVVLPMHWFDGFFDCSSLCPSSLCSGLRIRYNLQNMINSFVVVYSGTTAPGVDATAAGPLATALAGVTFNINNPQIVVDSYELNPLMYRKLQEKSASQGLDYTFKTAYFQSTTLSNIGSINVELNKAVARALSVSMLLVPSQGVSPYTLDPNQTLKALLTSYNSRVGSLTFPGPSALQIQGVQTLAEIANNSSEYYHLSQMAYKKCAYDGSMWPAAVRYSDFAQGFYNLTQPLETSSLDLSGLPINNSRSFSALLNFSVSTGGGNNVTGSIYTYLCYVSVLKVFLKESVLKL